MNEKRIIIVGGGFAGIRTALSLSKTKGIQITLISDKTHFEYYPRLYRVVTGRTPLEVCIPLEEIFKNTNVSLVKDSIVEFAFSENMIIGKDGSRYAYDHCVLALGSETAYFNIPGLEELSFSFKSISEALVLKRHIHTCFSEHLKMSPEEQLSNLRIVIVGGGPSGVELAGELSEYLEHVSKMHKVDPSWISIDLIEASPRLVPALPDEVSERVKDALTARGIHVHVNHALVKNEIEEVYLKDMTMKTKTVIWTAGVTTNKLYQTGIFEVDKRGRVSVDEYMRAKGYENVFVIGDGAQTKYAGLAQTALYDGMYVAKAITSFVKGNTPKKYIPKPIAYAVPVSTTSAFVVIGGKLRLSGYIGSLVRDIVDFKFFLSILPFRKAWSAFHPKKRVSESCETCKEGEE